MKRRILFFVIGIPFCFAFPCFATGCHTFGLKIATAALRPRNDTKLERFCLENRRFSFFAVIFCAVSLRTAFQTFRSGNCSVFPQNLKPFRFPAKPIKFVIARRAHFAPDAAIFDDAICHSVTNYGCAERNRALK